MSARHCRRKHWRLWRTKTLPDGSRVVVCPHCGEVNEPHPPRKATDG